MAEFAVSRAVVRAALVRLRQEGLLARVRGLGTFGDASPFVQTLQQLHGVSRADAGDDLARRTHVTVLAWRDMVAPEIIVKDLAVETGDLVLCVDYVTLVDGEPVSAGTNYLRRPESQQLQASMFRTDWYALLAEGGIDWAESTLSLESVVADEFDAEVLQTPPARR